MLPEIPTRRTGGLILKLGERMYWFYDGTILAYQGPNHPYGIRRKKPTVPGRSYSTVNSYMRWFQVNGWLRMDDDDFFKAAALP